MNQSNKDKAKILVKAIKALNSLDCVKEYSEIKSIEESLIALISRLGYHYDNERLISMETATRIKPV